MAGSDSAAILDTIARLADEIARASPESADKARQIATLAGEVAGSGVDRSAVRDAIETHTADSDLSDGAVRSTTEAVVRAMRENE